MLKECIPQALSSKRFASLNPYFNGTCSKSHNINSVVISASCVLILILMEHAQRVLRRGSHQALRGSVLILILMEHAQRG